MLNDSDLDAAVAEGIVTAAQATALRELGHKRERERAVALGHEERFRFMRGFNDVFFAIGVVLFVAGLLYFTPRGATGYAVAAAIVWGLAEVLVDTGGRVAGVVETVTAVVWWSAGHVGAGSPVHWPPVVASRRLRPSALDARRDNPARDRCRQ